ncbi:GNAT family N-acetyltransferase [Alkalihalobacillus sp. CinArs1]|uniref:GNAT family N-acetyltransferase n=1 Tax=Alkalihalobacillus sp. CinArs1 TaxID=2995314 RepID=UPI0022DE5D22|nr:GNAT family N-acetyltransferase [Alkalihalobacillus sp. CinArs1]
MIREAISRDVKGLAHLMGELGYPTSVEEMEKRMCIIFENQYYQTYVYVDGDVVVGMIGFMHCYRYESSDSYIRINGFVVDSHARGKGIGKSLLHFAESWAEENGASLVTLNSGNRPERIDAHAFYERCGFVGSATGFYKKL